MGLVKCNDCGEMVPEDQFYIAGEQCLKCAEEQEYDAIHGTFDRFVRE